MPADPQTIAALARRLRAGEVTSEAVTTDCLTAIAQRNTATSAYITVTAELALAQARQADRERAAGLERGPLHGVPISLKDLLDVAGLPTTAASRVRADHVAAADAPVVARLRAAGAVLLGKTNLHEFAFGTTSDETAWGPVRHPLDPTRSPGGSSGGSAVSVVEGMAWASIGTDTGGSVRIPAAACGLVGLKPALGEVSTVGVVPLSRTMDHVGPLCRSVEDAGLLYDTLVGTGGANSGAPGPEDSPEDGRSSRSRPRLGVLRGYFEALLDPGVAACYARACERLAAAGVLLEDVMLPSAADIAPVYLHIVLAEAAAYHAHTLDTRPDDYSPGIRLRLEMGRYVLGEDYARALRGREVLRGEVEQALAGREGLMLPALALPAPPIGAATVRIGTADEPLRNAMLRLTQLFNLTGHPALTLPCGTTADGWPVGLQLAGPAHDTPALLHLARTVESRLAA